jgi:Rrf2 family protein
MRVISKFGEYGLRTLMYMAANRSDRPYFNIRVMAQELDISFHFLTKILQGLTQKGLLQSYRGPSGGIGFLVPPEEITLATVIRMLEGDDFFDNCLLGLPGCGERKPCPVHVFWAGLRETLKAEFETTTLANLGQQVLEKHFRLTA